MPILVLQPCPLILIIIRSLIDTSTVHVSRIYAEDIPYKCDSWQLTHCDHSLEPGSSIPKQPSIAKGLVALLQQEWLHQGSLISHGYLQAAAGVGNTFACADFDPEQPSSLYS